MVDLDIRVRHTWDLRALGRQFGISHESVAKIMRQARGPRPKPHEQPHDRRTAFLRPDVMWSSDFLDLPDGHKLLKTLDECSRYRVGLNQVVAETALAAVRHGQETIARMGRKPLVWKYDHGTAFTSCLFQEFLRDNQIVPYPIPPRAPWAQGRVERDHQEVLNWFYPVLGSLEAPGRLDKELAGCLQMLNYIKPRAVLGYNTSAEVYFSENGIEDINRADFLNLIVVLKLYFGQKGGERSHRKAVRLALQDWNLYFEWNVNEGPKLLTDLVA